MEKKITVIGVDSFGKEIVEGLSNDDIAGLNCICVDVSNYKACRWSKIRGSQYVIIVASDCTKFSRVVASFIKIRMKLLTLVMVPTIEVARQFANYADSATIALSSKDVSSFITMVSAIVNSRGHINIDFNDIKATLMDSKMFDFGIGQWHGEGRAIEAFHQAVKNFHIRKAANIVVAIATNSQSDFKLGELVEMNNCLQDKLGKCDIVWGTRTDNSLADTEISMFVLASIRL